MKNFILMLSFISVLGVTEAVKADTHIVSGSATSSVLLSESSSSWSDSYEATFGLGVGYDYAFTNGFQLGGETSVGIYDGGSLISLAVGPGYNFNSDIANSFFVKINLGYTKMHIDSFIDSDNTFLTLQVAKRFKLNESISFVPGIQVLKVLETDSPKPSISIDLFNFSLLF